MAPDTRPLWWSRTRRVAGAIVAMVAVVLGGSDAVAAEGLFVPGSTTDVVLARTPSVRATPPSSAPTGQDVSWPQCPAGRGGYGLPMPPRNAAFVVVGLTAGRGFTANPCVSAQAAWARTHGVRSSAYLVPTYPTRAEVRRFAPAGGTARQRIAAVGRAQARSALAVLARSGLRARSVWIDVERSRTRPWSANPDLNVALIEGVASTLRRAGYLPGLYTNASSWTEFTDDARLGLPEWRTVGQRGRAAALAACSARPLNGGRVLMVQHWTQTVDTDVACPVLTPAAARARWFAAP